MLHLFIFQTVFIKKIETISYKVFEFIIIKMSTEMMLKILTNEGFKFTENECCICYEKFIDNITFDKLLNLYYKLFKEKYNLNEDDEDEFFGEEPVRCYNDRFECINCKNVVCDTCIQNIPQEPDGRTGDYTTKFTCPICRTEDYRFLITYYRLGKYLPVEILRNIKNLKK